MVTTVNPAKKVAGSTGEQTAHLRCPQQMTCDAAKDPFPQSRVPICTSHDQIGTLVPSRALQLLRNRAHSTQHRFATHFDSMPSQIHFKVIKVSKRGPFEGLIGNFEYCDPFRVPQERQSALDRATRLSRLLPSDQNASSGKPRQPLRRDKDRSAGGEEHSPRIKSVIWVVWNWMSANHNEVSCSRFPGDHLAGKIVGRPPLHGVDGRARNAAKPFGQAILLS